MSISVTYFQRPTGARKELEITEINADDEAWFKANNIKLSMEDDVTNDSFITYADYGDPEDEAIEFSLGKSCRETLKRLREITAHKMERAKNV